MEGFWAYRRIVKKTGPQPFWTPVAPLHRVVSYPLSWVYTAVGLTPLAVTLIGLALAVDGVLLVMAAPLGSPLSWVGVASLNLGVIHDACDGEVARYRIKKGVQDPKVSRVGIMADFWAFAVFTQALIPLALGIVAWRAGGPWCLAVLGVAAALVLLASYVVGFAKSAYWPERASRVREESFSFAAGGGPLLRFAQKVYFNLFETAMLTFHASVVLVLWGLVGGHPWWALVYAGFVGAALLGAFLVATVRTFQTFDRPN